jgi:hypothetical protein
MARHACLIGRPGVALDLPQTGMSADAGDLVCTTAGLSKSATGRLPQPVRRASLRKSSRVTTTSEPLCERHRLERLAAIRHKERQVVARRSIEHRREGRGDRDRKQRSGLLLADGQHTVANVLSAHPNDIGAPLGGVQQQGKRQSRLSADEILSLKRGDMTAALRNVLDSPGILPELPERRSLHRRS